MQHFTAFQENAKLGRVCRFRFSFGAHLRARGPAAGRADLSTGYEQELLDFVNFNGFQQISRAVNRVTTFLPVECGTSAILPSILRGIEAVASDLVHVVAGRLAQIMRSDRRCKPGTVFKFRAFYYIYCT